MLHPAGEHRKLILHNRCELDDLPEPTETDLSASESTTVRNLDEWLKGIDLGEHASRLAENDIDFDVLPELTDEDLKELGLSLGHRKRLLKAIRDLGGTDAGQAATTAPPLRPAAPVRPLAPRPEAERRHLTVMFVDLVGSTELS